MNTNPYESILNACRKASRSATVSAIELGARTQSVLGKRVCKASGPGARRRIRAQVFKDIQVAMVEAGFKSLAAGLNRAVAAFWLAEVFGQVKTRKLPMRTLRSLSPVLRRDPKHEVWFVKPAIENGALTIFARAVAAELTAAEVKLEVDAMLDRKPRTAKPKSSPARRVMNALAKLSSEQQVEVYHALRRKFDKELPAGNISIPMAEPPGKVAEVRKLSFADRLSGRRAG